jgi:AbrB family looped-hinge helix DNA binding protein
MAAENLVLVGQRGTITIPKPIREALGLEVGSHLRSDLVDGAIVLRPVRVTDDDRARRARLIDETNAAYARLREDPEAWQGLMSELAEWEVTLSDGLEPGDE